MQQLRMKNPSDSDDEWEDEEDFDDDMLQLKK